MVLQGVSKQLTRIRRERSGVSECSTAWIAARNRVEGVVQDGHFWWGFFPKEPAYPFFQCPDACSQFLPPVMDMPFSMDAGQRCFTNLTEGVALATVMGHASL